MAKSAAPDSKLSAAAWRGMAKVLNFSCGASRVNMAKMRGKKLASPMSGINTVKVRVDERASNWAGCKISL